METGLYVALSSQVALERRLTTIADNMANTSTVGYRATGVKFENLVTGTGSNSVSFVSSGDTYIANVSGSLRETGNPLDFAIQGDAWFGFETPQGTVMTRDGRFSMLTTGELVTVDGHPVLDAGGAPLQLDPLGGPPESGADGMLRQNGRPIGAIGLFQFTPGANFIRFGNSGIVPDGNPIPIVDRHEIGVAQGFVEDSNVNAVHEMMELIQVQRAFDQVSALMRDSENAMDESIRTLASS
ncbi:MAG: flagellar basal-body rod protein FlgF [Rhizobiaceae bacterium]|nr:flagellar basal-body rod protein FlgF [Rhizobiaceae bacterium]